MHLCLLLMMSSHGDDQRLSLTYHRIFANNLKTVPRNT